MRMADSRDSFQLTEHRDDLRSTARLHTRAETGEGGEVEDNSVSHDEILMTASDINCCLTC